MQLGHSPVKGVEIAVDLANTAPDRSGGEDEIAGVASLRTFADSHMLLGTDITATDLPAVHRIRTRIIEVLECEDLEQSATILNALIERAPAMPRMRRHDGIDWHIDWYVDGVDFPDHLAAQMAVGLMEHLVADGFTRLGTCQAEDCRRFFVDQTRNRSKRFCDGRNCGGRTHARDFRRRQT